MGVVGFDGSGEAEKEGSCLAGVFGMEDRGVEIEDLVVEDGGDVNLAADEFLVLGNVEIPDEEDKVLEGDPLRAEVTIVLVQLFFVIGELEVHVPGQDVLFAGGGQAVDVDGFVDRDEGGLENLFVDGNKPRDVGGLCGRGYFEGEGVALAGVCDQGLLLTGEQAGMDVVRRGGLSDGADSS